MINHIIAHFYIYVKTKVCILSDTSFLNIFYNY